MPCMQGLEVVLRQLRHAVHLAVKKAAKRDSNVRPPRLQARMVPHHQQDCHQELTPKKTCIILNVYFNGNARRACRKAYSIFAERCHYMHDLAASMQHMKPQKLEQHHHQSEIPSFSHLSKVWRAISTSCQEPRSAKIISEVIKRSA